VQQALLVKVFARPRGRLLGRAAGGHSGNDFALGFAALVFIFKIRASRKLSRAARGACRRARREGSGLGSEALARLAHERHGLGKMRDIAARSSSACCSHFPGG
jgi:hypothetical protein